MSNTDISYEALEQASKNAWNAVQQIEASKRTADSEIDSLMGTWQGKDAETFRAKWDETKSDNSSHQALKNATESYARFLDYALSQFHEKQDIAYEKANWI